MQPRSLSAFYENFPDAVWARLKAWAKIQAQTLQSPTLLECTAYVEQTAREISGRDRSLRNDVVEFYAGETAEMVARFAAELLAEQQAATAT